jgi:hypothetical protein
MVSLSVEVESVAVPGSSKCVLDVFVIFFVLGPAGGAEIRPIPAL